MGLQWLTAWLQPWPNRKQNLCFNMISWRALRFEWNRNHVFTLDGLSLTMLCFEVSQKSWGKETWHLMTQHQSVTEKTMMAVIKCNSSYRSTQHVAKSSSFHNDQKRLSRLYTTVQWNSPRIYWEITTKRGCEEKWLTLFPSNHVHLTVPTILLWLLDPLRSDW